MQYAKGSSRSSRRLGLNDAGKGRLLAKKFEDENYVRVFNTMLIAHHSKIIGEEQLEANLKLLTASCKESAPLDEFLSVLEPSLYRFVGAGAPSCWLSASLVDRQLYLNAIFEFEERHPGINFTQREILESARE
jgi:hypothetical protein